MCRWALSLAVLGVAALFWALRVREPEHASRVRVTAAAEVETRAASAPASRAPEATHTVSGTVVDEEHRPVAGAMVRWARDAWATSPEWARAETDADGAFTLERRAEKEGLYVAAADGYATQVFHDAATAPRLVLRRGRFEVRVRLVDEDEEPVVGAPALLDDFWEGGQAIARSDDEGRLVFAGLASVEKSESIVVRASGFVEDTIGLSLRQLQGYRLDLGMVTLDHGGVVRGVVRDNVTGEPIGGASVAYDIGDLKPRFDIAVRSAADGSFEMRGVSPQAVRLLACAEGCLPYLAGWRESDMDGEMDPKMVLGGQRSVFRDVFVERSVAVGGVVVSGGGKPVAGAHVSIETKHGWRSPRNRMSCLDFSATTDARGEFEVADWYVGSTVRIFAKHVTAGVARMEACADGQSVRMVLRPGCEITGRVVDGSGRPVARADLRLEGDGVERKDKAGDEGRFSFTRCTPGQWCLDADAPDHAGRRVAFETAEGQRRAALGDIVLAIGYTIEGVVVDSEHRPVDGIDVAALGCEERTDGEDNGSAITDACGRFRITGLHSEALELHVAGWSTKWCSETLATQAGRTDLVITLKRRIAVRGRVLGSGRPLADAEVIIRPGTFGQSWTESDGSFVRTVRPDEALRIEISHPLFKTIELENVKPWEGVRDFELPSGRVFHGTVVDEGGSPLAGMRVLVETAGHADRRCVYSDARGHRKAGGLEEGPTILTLSCGPDFACAEPIRVPAGIDSRQLVARKGYCIRGSARRRDGSLPEVVIVKVFRADGVEVGPASPWWEAQFGRVRSEPLAAGRYRVELRGRSPWVDGKTIDYGTVTIEVTLPGPDLSVVLPK